MADERMARGRQRAGERTHGRVLAVMGVVTAVVVVVAVAVGVAFSGVFGALTSQHAGATATVAPACSPATAIASVPTDSDLKSVSMVSATDGWAVGQVLTPEPGESAGPACADDALPAMRLVGSARYHDARDTLRARVS